MASCDLAVDSRGDAIATWAVEMLFEFQAVWASYRPAGGSWEPAVELLSPQRLFVDPKTAISSEGEALVAWGGGPIEATAKPRGGSWGEAEALTEMGTYALLPQVAFDEAGNTIAAWQLSEEGGKDVVQAASRPAGAGWQKPEDLSPGADSFSPQLGMDSAGGAMAIWEEGSADRIEGVEQPPGGPWGTPVVLSTESEEAQAPRLAVNRQGEALATWEAQEGGEWSVRGAEHPAGGGWSAPTQISASAPTGELFPEVAIDDTGDGIAAWSAQRGSSYLVEAAGYAAVGPSLDALEVPPSGVAGSPVAMSVHTSDTDVWSLEPQVRWHFGDGSSTSGSNPSHVYGAPGTYQVTVESDDTVGHVTTLQRTISIAPAPPRTVPSNHFRVLRAAIRHNGRIYLLLRVPGAGVVRAKAKAKVPSSGSPLKYRVGTAETTAVENVPLVLKLPSRAMKAVKEARRLRAHLVVGFTPRGGASYSKHLSIAACLRNCPRAGSSLP